MKGQNYFLRDIICRSGAIFGITPLLLGDRHENTTFEILTFTWTWPMTNGDSGKDRNWMKKDWLVYQYWFGFLIFNGISTFMLFQFQSHSCRRTAIILFNPWLSREKKDCYWVESDLLRVGCIHLIVNHRPTCNGYHHKNELSKVQFPDKAFCISLGISWHFLRYE